MKMIKFSIGMLVMPCLLVVSLVCSVIAIFAPYAVEWMLGLVILGLAAFGLCYLKAISAGISLLFGFIIVLNPAMTFMSIWVFTGITLIIEGVFDAVSLFLQQNKTIQKA